MFFPWLHIAQSSKVLASHSLPSKSYYESLCLCFGDTVFCQLGDDCGWDILRSWEYVYRLRIQVGLGPLMYFKWWCFPPKNITVILPTLREHVTWTWQMVQSTQQLVCYALRTTSIVMLIVKKTQLSFVRISDLLAGEYSYFMTVDYPWVPVYYYGDEGKQSLCSAD